MASCESAIWEYLKKIEPTPTQKDGAVRSHNYLRDILCTGQFASRIKTSYLSGSYARDTAIAPLDDVDIIFVVNPLAWQTGLLSSTPSPETILRSFANAVRYRYPNSSVRTQRRSICLQLNRLDIDVVPAIEADSTGQMILVPDAETGNWIKSSPKQHSDIATKINQARNGNFKPLVKLLKNWNSNLPSTANFKSFIVETMAARLFQEVDIPSLEDGLLRFFDFMAYLDGKAQAYSWTNKYGMSLNGWAVEVFDLAGTGSNLVANLDADRRQKFLDHAVRSRNKMQEAQQAMGVDTACKRVSEALRL
ncbi:MAG: hypothetical protein ABL860_09755 [Candidatus Nitrotoga sp.]